jgi:hypothetical protein
MRAPLTVISPVRLLWSYKRPFLLVMTSVFLLLAVIIFLIPQRLAIRSSIEIGSELSGDREEFFEPSDVLAKRVTGVYAPETLRAMLDAGTPEASLGQIDNPLVESIGSSIVIANFVSSNVEAKAKEFQDLLSERIIKDQAARAQGLRERVNSRVNIERKALSDLQDHISERASEVNRISTLIASLEGDLKEQRSNLAPLLAERSSASPQFWDESTGLQLKVTNQRISSLTELIVNLMREQSHTNEDVWKTRLTYDAQAKATSNAELEQSSFKEARIVLRPFALPSRTLENRLSLLLVAATFSALAALGIVALLYNISADRG